LTQADLQVAKSEAFISKTEHNKDFLVASSQLESQFLHQPTHDHPSIAFLLPQAISIPCLHILSAHLAALHV
jgi:hypothetical protein